MPRATFWLVVFAVTSAVLSAGREAACQQTAWYEGFEGPNVSWRIIGGNAQYRIEFHGRVRGEAHTGDGSEGLRLSGTGGNEVYIGHDIGRPRIIDDLLPTVWVKADRPGIQLLAHVVLPRNRDPKTGQPLSTVLAGSSYSTVGRWQQLRLEDMPRLLARQTRVLRTQYGPTVDSREAYIEQILLNVYGGPGVTNVWIDDLDIAGYVGVQPGQTVGSGPVAMPDGWLSSSETGASAASAFPRSAPGMPPLRTDRAHVRLVGSVLMVDNRPVFPRIIQYQGEPLRWLKQLGFNTVWLAQLPTPEMLQEAAQLELWLICPPPCPSQPDSGDGEPPIMEIGPAFDRVLAWDLGTGPGGDHVDQLRRWAEQTRAADRKQSGRPMLCRPVADLRAYSRYVDLLMLGRPPLGSSLELSAYGTWIRERPRLARPGTPIWTTVQTQPDAGLEGQWAALTRGAAVPSAFPPEQIRLLVYTTITAGSRGLLFQSRSPLTADNPETRARAMILELLNLELDLAEPWLAAGNFVTTIAGNEPQVIAGVLQSDRARLVVPIWSTPGAQLVTSQSATHSISFLVPGVPLTYNAYHMVPGSLKPMRHRRVTGGTQVTLDEFALTSMVLLGHDPPEINGLTRRTAQIGRRAAELQRQLAAEKLRSVRQVYGQLAGQIPPIPQATTWLTMAEKELQTADQLLLTRDDTSAYLQADRAMRPLRLLERTAWEAAIGRSSPLSSPAAVSFATLPWQPMLVRGWNASPPGPNQLPGGDFEQPALVFQTGWQHVQHVLPGIQTAADLTHVAAHAGNFGLRLTAKMSQPDQPALLVESPPIWIVSPPVNVEAGQWVCIQGWVNIPEPITGSVDGLLVLDSLSGEALAQRLNQTKGWQQFAVYRIAPQRGSMTITLALSGLGEARIDDLTVRPVGRQSP